MMKAKLMLSDLLNQLSFAICIIRKDYTIVSANEYFVTRAKYISDTLVGRNILTVFPEVETFLKRKIDTAFVIESPSFSSWEHAPHILPFTSSRPISGVEEKMFQDLEFIPLHSDNGQLEHVCLCVYDVTTQACQQQEIKAFIQLVEKEHSEVQKALLKLKEAQSQLLQSEKMASIGQLSAGIAHEINNPIGFISSNLQSLKEYFKSYNEAFDEINKKIIEKGDDSLIEDCKSIFLTKQLDYLIDDIGDLIKESLEGSSRVMSIVKNLKEFSHVDNSEWGMASIEKGIESTLKIINNELKYNVELIKDYHPDTPEIFCQPMQLNQVFLNLLVNASQAIEESGSIFISIQPCGTNVEVVIKDSGCGMDKKTIKRIFEPFYTTKPIGSGTGLGLSVSYNIIKAHQGEIQVTSELGQGSCFKIILPQAGPKKKDTAL
ncbi:MULTISPECIES: sensor histidine kinase [unclassified Vibrio]|uniref:histidine kinase n=1 Tax=Vibrio sp. HB236076 TaxID=3232307 RepID=A0AB39HM42_9VIBR|nr:ATP-binding protein [Vibrio sp. HB161653]MDP5252695.1 ATP-binding protein [Vibrio sp. HB161653]